jgi:hypothetical protein
MMISQSSYGQKFSIESVISDQYIEKKAPVRKDSFRERYYSIFSPLQPGYIPVPDSLAWSSFAIKKGERVTRIFNKTVIGSDIISGFECAVVEGAGTLFYFTLSQSESRHRSWYDIDKNRFDYYFYVIGPHEVKIPDLIPESGIPNDSLLTILIDFFLKERGSEMIKETYGDAYMQDLAFFNADTLRTLISRHFHMTSSALDFDGDSVRDWILEASPIHSDKVNCKSFSFILTSAASSPHFIPFSDFEFVIEVDGSPYALFNEVVPDTGIRGRTVYSFDKGKKEIIRVFSDYSMSD